MDRNQDLLTKQKETQQALLHLKDKTPLATIIRLPSKIFPRFFTEDHPLFWLVNIIILNLFIFIPGIFVSYLLSEFDAARDIWVTWIAAVEVILAALIACYIASQDLLITIANQIIEKIIKMEHLSALFNWVETTWSLKNNYSYIILIWIAWVALGPGGVSLARGLFIGYGFTLIAMLAGILGSYSIYYVGWVTILTIKLKEYEYELNVFLPADSEIINDISVLLNKQFYILASYFAILTLVVSLHIFDVKSSTVFVLPVTMLCWVLLTLQFLLSRSTIKSIVDRAKWRLLNKIQTKINSIEATGDLSDKDIAEKLLRLVDAYKQVLASRTNIFDLKSLSTFISQLMLPLLGILLGNLDKLSSLLR